MVASRYGRGVPCVGWSKAGLGMRAGRVPPEHVLTMCTNLRRRFESDVTAPAADVEASALVG